jgi:hypothetical protein
MRMIRKWLRALIGWGDVADLVDNIGVLLAALNRQLDTLEAEIGALKYQRNIREGNKIRIVDWEQLQADFAANPDNYKEN